MRIPNLPRFLPIILLLIAVKNMSATPKQSLKPDEVRPVLEVVSRLGHVVVVPDTPYFHGPSLRICWVDSPSFSVLDAVLWKYPGLGRWYFMQDLPSRCLAVEPNPLKNEPFVVGETDSSQPKARLNGFTADESHGLRVPTAIPSIVTPEMFRTMIVREMPKLGKFIEERLNLEGNPSLGIEFSNSDLRLPFVEDQDGPGAGVVLAADPLQYSRTKLSTSANDRTLHFWITDEECDDLWTEMSQNGGNNEIEDVWPLLSKVVTARYGGLVIAPNDVDALASETARLRSRITRVSLVGALDRILSACRSAKNYHLGFYIYGE